MKSYLYLLLCIYIRLLKADTSLDFPNAQLILSYNGDDLYPFPEKCYEILNEFADDASEFTKCSIQFARPIRICERCIDCFVKFDKKYQELLNTVVNGTSCRSIFISHDRLDAVLEYHNNIQAVWDKGNCNSCFDWSNNSATISNSTKRFKTMYNETRDCIKSNNNKSIEVCEKCMPYYIKLDDYYKTLSSDGIGVDSVCMDIVDSMNLTRFTWSKVYNCCQLRRSPEIVFLCCTGIISFLPILYYLALRFCGPIRDLPNVLRQSRFKQSFLRSTERNIN